MNDTGETILDRPRLGIEEVPFGIDELFFSRTDERGVIQAGNTVFVRVSGFPEDELIGAPHKLVRHPDMPRAVFQFAWDRLKAGEPVAAYVKNRSKDGRHYWVFAVMTPVEGGYLSVRLKPSSPTLARIEKIYAAQRQRETADGIGPEQSRDELLAAIRDAGFSGYDSFEAESLAAELIARSAELRRPKDLRLERFLSMSRAIHEVEMESEAMMTAFEAIRTIPLNMRILASRLEAAGGPISAISVNYGSMSDEMSAWVRTFIHGQDSAFSRIRDAIVSGLFHYAIAGLMSEMQQSYLAEVEAVAQEGDGSRRRLLADQSRAYQLRSSDELKRTGYEAARLSRSVLDMKRYITGLSSTRMMCKIESATLSKSGETLVGIVDQLDASQDGIEERLARISELNSHVQASTALLRNGAASV
ncbi:PAS domain-containing protein [Histidinibacterium aquaticum]|uniref:PAS domain-containing protein n=1 Tax=Histidinibacterium aquaticum TaxID=2613962 RepID=A0A5J5GFQ3_9RHOB|nr:PAS domain-containing protein [Histidinibacterium aquaticum]KAA9006961.1 PAS domain-containing protein [Histidinibacterium aquaticum]